MKYILFRVLVISAIIIGAFQIAYSSPFQGIEEEANPTNVVVLGTEDDEPVGVFATFEFSRELKNREQIRLVTRLISVHYSLTGEIPADWVFIAAYTSPKKFVTVIADLYKQQVTVTEEWNEERIDNKYRCKIWHGDALGVLDYLLKGISSSNRDTHYGRDIKTHFEKEELLQFNAEDES